MNRMFLIFVIMTLKLYSADAWFRVVNEGCSSKYDQYRELGIIEQDTSTNVDPDRLDLLDSKQRSVILDDLELELISFDRVRKILTINSCLFSGDTESVVRFQTNGKNTYYVPSNLPTQRPNKGCKYKVGENCDVNINTTNQKDNSTMYKYFQNPNSQVKQLKRFN